MADSGYPSEPLKNAFDPDVQRQLAPTQKPKELVKELPNVAKQLFCEIGERSRALAIRGSTPVTREEDFKACLSDFTWGLLDGWDANLWENVILGGGAVLGDGLLHSTAPSAPTATIESRPGTNVVRLKVDGESAKLSGF